MITIIHGDDILSSRNYYLAQRKDTSIDFDAETDSIVEFAQILQGFGLFTTSKNVTLLIENLFTRKGAKNFTSILEILQQNTDLEIYIWADKEIASKTLSQFPKHDNRVFKIPQSIWAFLDGIKPKNPSNVILFQNALQNSDPEYMFLMIVRQFRLLLGIKEHFEKNIDEIQRLAPWQKSKLQKQASLFTIKELKNIYEKLSRIDKELKTGSSGLNIIQNIDILLLDL